MNKRRQQRFNMLLKALMTDFLNQVMSFSFKIIEVHKDAILGFFGYFVSQS